MMGFNMYAKSVINDYNFGKPGEILYNLKRLVELVIPKKIKCEIFISILFFKHFSFITFNKPNKLVKIDGNQNVYLQQI